MDPPGSCVPPSYILFQPYPTDFSILMTAASLPFARVPRPSFVNGLSPFKTIISLLLIRRERRSDISSPHQPSMVSCKLHHRHSSESSSCALQQLNAIITCHSFSRRPSPPFSAWNGNDLAFQVVICWLKPASRPSSHLNRSIVQAHPHADA